MNSILAKAVIVAFLTGSALATAKTDEKTYQGSASTEYISFDVASLSTVSVGYSWSDMLLTKNRYSSYENDASSLTWALTGTTTAKGSFSDLTGTTSYIGSLDLGELAAGSYKLTLNGSWDPVTLTGTENSLRGWSVTNGQVNITKNSLSMVAVTAVPEPETYAMLLAGLGLMGFVARRRTRAAD